jgi:hypothetical protein
MNSRELHKLVEDADHAFWHVIAERFPQARSGDLSPWATIKLHLAQEEAVKEWIANNVPTPPD